MSPTCSKAGFMQIKLISKRTSGRQPSSIRKLCCFRQDLIGQLHDSLVNASKSHQILIQNNHSPTRKDCHISGKVLSYRGDAGKSNPGCSELHSHVARRQTSASSWFQLCHLMCSSAIPIGHSKPSAQENSSPSSLPRSLIWWWNQNNLNKGVSSFVQISCFFWDGEPITWVR